MRKASTLRKRATRLLSCAAAVAIGAAASGLSPGAAAAPSAPATAPVVALQSLKGVPIHHLAADAGQLRFEGESINPQVSCGMVLKRIAKAQSHAEQSKLARFDWFNCVLSVEQQRIGEYPQGAWEKFLANHGIREHYIEEDVDD